MHHWYVGVINDKRPQIFSIESSNLSWFVPINEIYILICEQNIGSSFGATFIEFYLTETI